MEGKSSGRRQNIERQQKHKEGSKSRDIEEKKSRGRKEKYAKVKNRKNPCRKSEDRGCGREQG